MASLLALIIVVAIVVGAIRAIAEANGPLGEGAEGRDAGSSKKNNDWPVYCKIPLTRPEQVLSTSGCARPCLST